MTVAEPSTRPGTGRLAHRTAIVLGIAILPLISVGAGVTSKNAGMAFPDWPTSDGRLLNPEGWLGDTNKVWEHSHRLIGWAVGLLAIVVAVSSWRRGSSLRCLGTAILVAIIIQGVLGGIRVREVSTILAMVHGVWGQVCVCLVWVMVLFTSPAWPVARGSVQARATHVFQRGCVAGLIVTLMQLLFGAVYRHFGYRYALAAHFVWAVAVFVVLAWLAMWTLEQYSRVPTLARLGKILAVLLVAQLVLGGASLLVTDASWTWSATAQWAVPSVHVVVGALLLACVASLTLSAYHFLAPHDAVASETQPLGITT